MKDLLKKVEYIDGCNIDVVYREGRGGDMKHSCVESEKGEKVLEWC